MNSLKYTCHALLLALPLMGCVAENASVVIHGVIDPTTDDCSNPTSAVSFLPGTGVDVSLLYAYSSWLNVRNYATTESPWQSSGGGSSSGSALDPAIPNRNTVFINTVIFSCIEINGSARACKGA
ncbi:MAG: hypothetical protein FWC40_03610, partial [Proteobacteria bacterium]|nr:hypothetical protein [Pseudomonadota bacterium]